MSVPRCPQCGAPRGAREPDPLARCASCGALLFDGPATEGTLVARERFDAKGARSRVARALSSAGRAWLPGTPELVWFPFVATGDPGRPFRPLAQLPPLFEGSWRPAGADLVESGRGRPATAEGVDPGMHVVATQPVPARALVVHFPLYRVPLAQADEVSAAWCDGVDGRVLLPPELARPETTARDVRLGRWVRGAALGGSLCGLLFPFPYSALAVALAAAALWRSAGTR